MSAVMQQAMSTEGEDASQLRPVRQPGSCGKDMRSNRVACASKKRAFIYCVQLGFDLQCNAVKHIWGTLLEHQVAQDGRTVAAVLSKESIRLSSRPITGNILSGCP